MARPFDIGADPGVLGTVDVDLDWLRHEEGVDPVSDFARQAQKRRVDSISLEIGTFVTSVHQRASHALTVP